MTNLARLKEIKDLRVVWPHEALDFTPWLAEEKNLPEKRNRRIF